MGIFRVGMTLKQVQMVPNFHYLTVKGKAKSNHNIIKKILRNLIFYNQILTSF